MTSEEKIADLKANFDYVLEGKDLEIKQLGERCNQLLKDKGYLTDELSKLKETLAQTVENDEVAYETLKLHDQEEIGMLNSKVTELEKENTELKKKCYKKAVKDYCELEKENKDLRDNYDQFKAIAEPEIERLQTGNADLEKRCTELFLQSNEFAERLTKAKEHIQTLISCLIDWVQEGDKDYCYIADAEQFIKDTEK